MSKEFTYAALAVGGIATAAMLSLGTLGTSADDDSVVATNDVALVSALGTSNVTSGDAGGQSGESAPSAPSTSADSVTTQTNYQYFVRFDGNGATNTAAYFQQFERDRSQALERNRFCLQESCFLGWATNSVATNVVYGDCATVSNLCTVAGGTNALYAVWQSTPGTNWYYVTEGNTNFEFVAVSPSHPTHFLGTGKTTRFMMTTRNAGDCRVAIDPVEGLRSNLSLTIDRSAISTNGVSVWSNVCVVTDLSVEEVKCDFATNYCYRFEIGNAATNSEYLVSIGAEGAQYTFEPCGGTLRSDALSKSLTFNWTVNTQIGYLPPLTNDVKYGTYTWDYSPDYSVTNAVFVTNAVERADTMLFAHWSKGVTVPMVFDWNLTNSTYGVITNVVCTNYFLQGMTVNLYNSSVIQQPSYGDWGFLGWTTNSAGTSGWNLSTIVVSNTATFYAQWTKEWKTSRTSSGITIEGYIGTPPVDLVIPSTIAPCPKPVIAIGDSAFADCTGLVTLSIPSCVRSIGDSAFEGCTSLTSVDYATEYPDDEMAEDGFLTDEIELGCASFAGCTSLTSVELPLGVLRLADELFRGCTALKTFTMPYTVDEIGESVFAGCNHLTQVCCSEVVDAIEAAAFSGCTRLRMVQFLGTQPSEVESDIFSGTQRNVLVGYFENMRSSCSGYCGGNWPALPGTWPDGSYARTLTWLPGNLCQRYKVSFNYNKDHSPGTSTITPRIYIAGRVFGLLAPTADDMGDDFVGWYTKPVGGVRIGDYREITGGMVVYAHWEMDEESEAEVGSRGANVHWSDFTYSEGGDFSGFYSSDDDMSYYAACVFNGIVVDSAEGLSGTIAFNFKAGSYSKLDDGLQSAFTAVILWNDGGTTTFSGAMNADGEISYEHGDLAFSAKVTKSGLCGALIDSSDEGGDYEVYAARNRLAMSSSSARSVVLQSLQAAGSTNWLVSVSVDEMEDREGYEPGEDDDVLTITFVGSGQATIVGRLSNGDRISASSTLVVGDGCCCLPVVIKSGARHGAFSFLLWLTWQSDGSMEIGDDVTIECAAGCSAEMYTE